MRRRLAPLALTALVLIACALVPSSPAGARSAPAYYVSLGDSYAIGYQPDPAVSLRFGYTHFVVAAERRRGVDLTLANFGCGGATTTSVLTSAGCPLPAPAEVPYPSVSQATAATDFIRTHRGHIALITVSIGGDDVTACAASAAPVTCVGRVMPQVATNLATLLTRVRAAAGPKVPIVGLTYPDVILGAWVHPPVSRSLATLSVIAFRLLINPTLRRAYQRAGGTFVDVTRATGAYTPLTRTTVRPPYGRIPVAVARACTYTWYCADASIHPRTVGYRLMGRLIVAALPRRFGSP
ncbi:MAG: SGNH/GDSL hydrolase family protein [Acidimicrobiales bacterium]